MSFFRVTTYELSRWRNCTVKIISCLSTSQSFLSLLLLPSSRGVKSIRLHPYRTLTCYSWVLGMEIWHFLTFWRCSSPFSSISSYAFCTRTGLCRAILGCWKWRLAQGRGGPRPALATRHQRHRTRHSSDLPFIIVHWICTYIYRSVIVRFERGFFDSNQDMVLISPTPSPPDLLTNGRSLLALRWEVWGTKCLRWSAYPRRYLLASVLSLTRSRADKWTLCLCIQLYEVQICHQRGRRLGPGPVVSSSAFFLFSFSLVCGKVILSEQP